MLDLICVISAYCLGAIIVWLCRKNSLQGGLKRALVWGGIVGLLLVLNDFYYPYFENFLLTFLIKRIVLGLVGGFLGWLTFQKCSKGEKCDSKM